MKRYDKRRRAAGIVLAGMMFVMAGCSKEPEELRLSILGNAQELSGAEAIESILSDYMEEDPYTTVSYENLEDTDYYEQLHSREASEEPDDIFMVNYDAVRELSENDNLEDLAELAKDIPFSDSIREQLESTGHRVYWVPAAVSAFGMYCNMELLERHHQKTPERLEEWVDVCEYFLSCGITPIIANNDTSLKTMAIAKSFYPLYNRGVAERKFEKVDKGEKELSTYLSEGFILVRDFCTRGYIDKKKALETEAGSGELEEFVKGESPFMLASVSEAERVKEMGPDFEFKVVPYPVLEEGSVLVINPEIRLSVSANGKDPERAKEFLSYFFREENIYELAQSHSFLGPLEHEPDPSLSEIQDIVEAYRTQVSVIGMDSHMESPVWELTSEVSRKLLEGEETEELMEWMDHEVAAARAGQ